MDIELIEYDWWGQGNAPPEQFKTTKQLQELGLAPVAPVGIIRTHKYDLKLYDPDNEKSTRQKRKPSPAQLAALKKGRDRSAFNRALTKWRECEGFFLEDKISAICWAKEVLRNPRSWRIVDTETTGLDCRDRIVEIAVVDLTGAPLLNTLVQPTGEWFMSPDAEAVHGISSDDLADTPTFPEVYPELVKALGECSILAYGANFDAGMVASEITKAGLLPLPNYRRWHCLMQKYSVWCGEWSYHHEDYRWQALSGSHRALGDSLAALSCLNEMASGSDTFTYPSWLIEQGLSVGVDLNQES